ncbi:MAG: hypothetical protein Kow00109_09680 [Acidobacteriota bacterium]
MAPYGSTTKSKFRELTALPEIVPGEDERKGKELGGFRFWVQDANAWSAESSAGEVPPWGDGSKIEKQKSKMLRQFKRRRKILSKV